MLAGIQRRGPDEDINAGTINIKLVFKAISREYQHLDGEAKKAREIQVMNSAPGALWSIQMNQMKRNQQRDWNVSN